MTAEERALDMAHALVKRDAETPAWRRRIEVGRGGLLLLATTLISLADRLARVQEERTLLWEYLNDSEPAAPVLKLVPRE